MARELQVELRRVGCYGGEVNGIWTPNAQKAMKAFTARVNAALPVDNPDDILLSLVRAHKGVGCAKDCATGHRRTEDGRCVPDALPVQASREPAARAEAARKLEPVGPGWATVTTSAPLHPVAPPPAGRMALAGPAGDASDAAADPPARPQAGREGGKRSRTARRESQHARARRPERSAVVRSSRSRFVESILYDRRSLN